MPLALPAVTVPSFLNAGFILASVSIVVPAFTCSSVSKVTSPLLGLLDDGHDLALEAAFGDGRGGLAVRLDGQLRPAPRA
jgi:hypothetical protein